MSETTTTALLVQGIPLTKAAIQQFAQETADLVLEDGSINPLDAYMKLKFIEQAAKDAQEQIKDSAMTEAMKYHRAERTMNGVAFDVRHTNGPLDWSQVPAITELEAEIKRIKAVIEGAAAGGLSEAMIADGVVVAVPPRKAGSVALAITFPKTQSN